LTGAERKPITEFPVLWAFVRDFYHLPGVADSINLEELKTYQLVNYSAMFNKAIPEIPTVDFSAPPNRTKL